MGELAKMRALLFYEQMKRHRANKIKSKAYHRIRKKQRLRQGEKEKELLREVDLEAYRLMEEKEARRRVEERMSLRHKNTSKWAKHVLQHGAHQQVVVVVVVVVVLEVTLGKKEHHSGHDFAAGPLQCNPVLI